MFRGFRFRLYPSKTTQRKLVRQRNLCLWLYNRLLDKVRRAWDERSRITQFETQALIVRLKDEENPALKEVYSKVLQMVNHQLWCNIRALAVLRKNGHRVGRLRFKGRNQFKTLNFNQSGFKISVRRRRLVLSKVGDIPIKLHQCIEGDIKGVIVKQYPSGKWYAILQVEKKEIEPLLSTGRTVGIDVGLKHFATDSKGGQIENPRFYGKSLHRIRLLHRNLTRKKRDSKNWVKARVKVARAYEQLTNQRNEFLHKLSQFYINNYDVIAVEELQIRNMMKNRKLGQRIMDALWCNFFQMLSYKAASAGRTVLKVNPRGTSQEYRFEKTLDRDYNAALNIHDRGLGRPSQPVEQGSLRRIPASAVVTGQILVMKQEALPLMVR